MSDNALQTCWCSDESSELLCLHTSNPPGCSTRNNRMQCTTGVHSFCVDFTL